MDFMVFVVGFGVAGWYGWLGGWFGDWRFVDLLIWLVEWVLKLLKVRMRR